MLAAACTVGPNYKRPRSPRRTTFRGRRQTPPPTRASFGDEPWAAVFDDEALRRLITTALAQNFDLRIAASRILQAEAQYRHHPRRPVPDRHRPGSARGSTAPIIDGEALPTAGLVQLGGALSWELDFWGKYRRATEAARAEIAASEWGRRAIVTSLVSQVASDYFVLRSLDLELEICAAHADVARGVAAADRGPRARRRHVARGRAPGRAARASRHAARSSMCSGESSSRRTR